MYLSTNRYTSKSSGFGFVEMATDAGARKAVELFHGYSLSDRPMTVQAIEQPEVTEWKGTSNTTVFRKLPRPVEESPNDDGKS
mgnify:CR=1 FL=1